MVSVLRLIEFQWKTNIEFTSILIEEGLFTRCLHYHLHLFHSSNNKNATNHLCGHSHHQRTTVEREILSNCVYACVITSFQTRMRIAVHCRGKCNLCPVQASELQFCILIFADANSKQVCLGCNWVPLGISYSL